MANTEENNIAAQLKPLFPEHDYNKLYYKQDIVTFTINGELGFYQAIRNVPRYVPITDRRYWNLLTTGEGNFIDDEEENNNNNNNNDNPSNAEYIKIKATKDNTMFSIGYVYYGDESGNEGGNEGGGGPKKNNLSEDIDTNHPYFEYSIDGGNTWDIITFITFDEEPGGRDLSQMYVSQMFTLDTDDEIMLRGINPNGFDNDNYVLSFDASEIVTVTGDIQTLIDKDLNNLTIPCVNTLFCYLDINIILSAETNLKCTGNVLTSGCFAFMFDKQPLLELPMELPNLTNDSFVNFDVEELNLGKQIGAFLDMYRLCISLTKMFDIPNIIINDNTDKDQSYIVYSCFRYCIGDTTFNVVNNDENTFTFECGIEFVDDNNKFDFCDWIGNTNGFILVY